MGEGLSPSLVVSSGTQGQWMQPDYISQCPVCC